MPTGKAWLNPQTNRYEPCHGQPDCVDGYWLTDKELRRWQEKYPTPKVGTTTKNQPND